jgi:hypothetical protein
MVVKPAPKTPRKIREKLKHMSMSAVGSWRMKSKGLKHIPAIIDSAYAWGEKEVEEAKKDPIVSYLMGKVEVMIKKCRDNIRANPETLGPDFKIFWPVEVLDLEEVKKELQTLLTTNLFSKDNPEDRKIAEEDIKRTGLSIGEEEMEPEQRIDSRIDFMNRDMKAWGEFFKEVYEVYKQHNIKMWLHIEGA